MDRPIVARCPICDGEIYYREELEIYDGVCKECFFAMEETDEDLDDRRLYSGILR